MTKKFCIFCKYVEDSIQISPLNRLYLQNILDYKSVDQVDSLDNKKTWGINFYAFISFIVTCIENLLPPWLPNNLQKPSLCMYCSCSKANRKNYNGTDTEKRKCVRAYSMTWSFVVIQNVWRYLKNLNFHLS